MKEYVKSLVRKGISTAAGRWLLRCPSVHVFLRVGSCAVGLWRHHRLVSGSSLSVVISEVFRGVVDASSANDSFLGSCRVEERSTHLLVGLWHCVVALVFHCKALSHQCSCTVVSLLTCARDLLFAGLTSPVLKHGPRSLMCVQVRR